MKIKKYKKNIAKLCLAGLILTNYKQVNPVGAIAIPAIPYIVAGTAAATAYVSAVYKQLQKINNYAKRYRTLNYLKDIAVPTTNESSVNHLNIQPNTINDSLSVNSNISKSNKVPLRFNETEILSKTTTTTTALSEEKVSNKISHSFLDSITNSPNNEDYLTIPNTKPSCLQYDSGSHTFNPFSNYAPSRLHPEPQTSQYVNQQLSTTSKQTATGTFQAILLIGQLIKYPEKYALEQRQKYNWFEGQLLRDENLREIYYKSIDDCAEYIVQSITYRNVSSSDRKAALLILNQIGTLEGYKGYLISKFVQEVLNPIFFNKNGDFVSNGTRPGEYEKLLKATTELLPQISEDLEHYQKLLNEIGETNHYFKHLIATSSQDYNKTSSWSSKAIDSLPDWAQSLFKSGSIDQSTVTNNTNNKKLLEIIRLGNEIIISSSNENKFWLHQKACNPTKHFVLIKQIKDSIDKKTDVWTDAHNLEGTFIDQFKEQQRLLDIVKKSEEKINPQNLSFKSEEEIQLEKLKEKIDKLSQLKKAIDEELKNKKGGGKGPDKDPEGKAAALGTALGTAKEKLEKCKKKINNTRNLPTIHKQGALKKIELECEREFNQVLKEAQTVTDELKKSWPSFNNNTQKHINKVLEKGPQTNHGHKHYKALKQTTKKEWENAIKSTQHGDAQYKPGIDIERIQAEAWEKGIPVNNGRPFKVMKFDKIIGANSGKETCYMRVEKSANTIHGHPITLEKFIKYTKKIKAKK